MGRTEQRAREQQTAPQHSLESRDVGVTGRKRTSGVGPAAVGPVPTLPLSRILTAARLSGKVHELGRIAPYSWSPAGRALWGSWGRTARGWGFWLLDCEKRAAERGCFCVVSYLGCGV